MSLRHTPLYSWHVNAHAKMVDFGGWEMPIQYSSIVKEHQAVRTAAGIFDVSHMGQIFVRGPKSLQFLQNLCTNDISRCGAGTGIYTHMCKPDGGIIDDLFVYSLSPSEFLIVANASTVDKDFEWMKHHEVEGVRLQNSSADWAMMALQGPQSENILKLVTPVELKRNQIQATLFEGKAIYISRTGYTGEDGFEILARNEIAVKLWQNYIQAGQNVGLLPCGLGARDTLRLESAYLLYGQDIDENRNSIESGPEWVIKFYKFDFIGKTALAAQKKGDKKREFVGFKCIDRAIPRHGTRIRCNNIPVGTITSGTFSPTLQMGIGMGYIPVNSQGDFTLEIHGKQIKAERVSLPFYKRS